jgi:hypothetical protein
MRRPLLAVVVALLAPFHCSLAQEANKAQIDAITEIAQCMAQGLPEDWVSAQMVVELDRAGAATGNVRYLVARKDAEDRPESFTPCDTDGPPAMLLALRAQQSEDRRGWTRARLALGRDGAFRLNFDYP